MAKLAKFNNIDEDDKRQISVSFNNSLDYSRLSSEYYPPGIDSKPTVNSTLLSIDIGTQNQKAIVGARKSSEDSKASPGETRIYSKAGDVDIYLKEDGTIEIDGNEKSFMTFDDFAINWNNLMSWLSSHTHNADGTPTTPPLEPITNDISDISESESPNVKTGKPNSEESK